MKKLLLILLCLPMIGFGQDNIILKDGVEINAKIEEVGESNIKYRKFSNQDGPMFTKSKDKIFMIKYANGEKEIFSNINTSLNGRKAGKLLVGGMSNFKFESTFENDSLSSTSQMSFTPSIGLFMTDNFVFGVAVLYNNFSVNSERIESVAAGIYLRGYSKSLFTQVGYAFSEDVDVFTAGIGFQLFANKSQNVSFNPIFMYYNRAYSNYDINQSGILIGGSFDLYLL
jgi:hypothetical protein